MSEIVNNCISGLNNVGRGFCGYAGAMFVQASLVIALLLCIDLFLRRRATATLRYWLWMLVVVKLLLPVSFSAPTGIGYWSGHYVHAALLKVWQVLATDEGPVQMGSDILSILPSTPLAPKPDALPALTESIKFAGVGRAALTWQGGLFLLWCVGVLILAGRMIQRWRFVRKLVDQGKPAPDDLVERLDRCRRLAGIRRRVDIKLSSGAYSPAVCGLTKPVILMPGTLLNRLSPEDLKAVLLHELAHVQRGDLWLNFLQTVLHVVYFYNPLVWLTNASVRRIREQAVDERVLVALGAQASSYSNTLIDIAEMAFARVSPALRLVGVAESRKSLEGRIRHMVTRPIPKNARMRVRDVLVVVAVGAIVLPMAAARAEMREDVPKLPTGIAELFGLSKDDVLAKFGQPGHIFYGDNQYTLDNLPEQYFMVYGEQGLSFAVGKDHVGGITLLGPDYVFSNGVHVGDSEAKVKQTFGAEYLVEETPFKDFLNYEGLGLSFEISKDDRSVMEINIAPDYGDPARQRAFAEEAAFVRALPGSIAQLDMDTADLQRVKKVFGEPLKYIWGDETFKADDLPDHFIAVYPAGVHIFMSGDHIVELRHEGRGSGYALKGGIRVGSTVEQVLAALGSPRKTVQGEPIDWSDSDNVLFRDIKGTKGHCYYHLPKQHLRLWFWNNKVQAIYMTRSDYGEDDEPSDPEFVRLLAQRIETLKIDTADRRRVMEIFGEPLKYIWGNKSFDADNLPDRFIMVYPSGFRVFMSKGKIVELRHEGPGTGYTFKGGIRVGSTVEEVLAVLGAPKKTVRGAAITWSDSHNVLYRDIEGDKGHDYYHCPDQRVRLWFGNDKVIAIYMTRSDYDK